MRRFNKFLIAVLAFAFTLGLSGSTTALAASPLTVNLGTAAPFAILAGTPAITESGAHTSAITGDVGLSPRTSADIGLWCSQMIGLSKIYGVDTAYTGGGFGTLCFNGTPSDKTLVDNAKLDLTTAYTDAANRTPKTTVPTELGGLTLGPGVYVSDSTFLQISAPTPLILDGQGNPNAVFIFEASDVEAPALVPGPGSVVQLTGQAQACNVFWRVNAATIDTTAVFKGTILAADSITVANGANIEGRLLAQTGQVTLINDTVAVPICTAATATTTPAAAAAAKLPSTGVAPSHSSIPWSVAIVASVFALSTLFVVIRRKKRAI